MPLFHRNSKSPLWNAGSILPERTTTIGEEEFVKTESPFHSIKAVDRTRAKLRTCSSDCRGCRPASAEIMVDVRGVLCPEEG